MINRSLAWAFRSSFKKILTRTAKSQQKAKVPRLSIDGHFQMEKGIDAWGMVWILQCEWGQGKQEAVREEGCPKQLILVWDIKACSLSLFFPEFHQQRVPRIQKNF